MQDDGTSAVEDIVRVQRRSEAGGPSVYVFEDRVDVAGDGRNIRQGWENVLARLATLYG